MCPRSLDASSLLREQQQCLRIRLLPHLPWTMVALEFDDAVVDDAMLDAVNKLTAEEDEAATL